MKVNDIFTVTKCRRRILCCVFLLSVAAHASASTATDTQILNKEISISVTDVSFEEALEAIARVAQVKFAYSLDQLNVQEAVTIRADKQPLRSVLEELCTPHNIRYIVHDPDAVISLKRLVNAKNPDQSQAPYNDQPESIQRMQVTGIVTDNNSQPMAGVNIVVRGTTQGTTSGVDGRYTINAEEGDVLVFSFIGYTAMEIIVGNQTAIDVVLQEDIRNLGEVVVNAGYWTVNEREQTGNISRITSKEISHQPVNNPLQAMQGRMTGVYIQQNTGVPGGGFSVQIRGRNSLRDGSGGTTNGNLPLYLVDGVPFTSSSLTSSFVSGNTLGDGNPLSTINPNDIESIEVLKDADATAIYGSRGANGVILITTKKAKAGRTNLDINLSSGIGDVANRMSLLGTPAYLEMRKEALTNDGYAGLLEDPAFDIYWPDLKLWDSTRYTNWQDKLIGGNAHITNAQVSLSGGNSNTQFSFGGGYYRETTVFPGDQDFQRASGSLHLNHTTVDSRFNMSVSLNYSSSVSDIPSMDLTGQALRLSPNAPALYDEEGNLNWENGTWTNPLSYLEQPYESTINNLVTNAALRYRIVKGLHARLTLGYSSMQVDEMSLMPLKAQNPATLAGKTGSSSFNDSNLKTWIIEPQLDYALKIGKGDLSLLVGSTFQESVQQGETLQATGYTNDALLENIDAAPAINIVSASYAQYRYAAFFARANYNWDGKYILNFTGRRDGSSRFGPGKQFANFGAVGAAWIFSNESFLKEVAFMSFGKLRASYGTTGNDAIGNYQYLSTYSATAYPYNNSTGLVVTRLSNPDYSWETNQKIEAAIDLGFIRDRITLSAAWYQNESSNQLVGFPLPAMTGQTSVQYNLPATVQNRGWEFMINTLNVTAGDFQWTTGFNITIPRNELVEFPELENYPVYSNRYDVGKSLYVYKGFGYEGVDPATGLYAFRDVDDDGIISVTGDRLALKEITQEWYGGLNNTFSWKGLQLDVFFQFVRQTALSPMRNFGAPGTLSNQPSFVMERWQQPGDETDMQKFTAFDPTGTVIAASTNYKNSDGIIDDASFVRLKNISLSWQLPAAWMQKAKMKGSRVYIQGQNLFTFTDYKGPDPETGSLSLPPLRMITAGLNITL